MRPSTGDSDEEIRTPRLHMLLTGLHPSLTSPISPGASGGSSGVQGVCVLKMCPPLTTKVILICDFITLHLLLVIIIEMFP